MQTAAGRGTFSIEKALDRMKITLKPRMWIFHWALNKISRNIAT
jgi:hypothetical protein